MHKRAEGKFRPRLIEVSRATAVVRLKAEKVRLAAVCAEERLAREALAGDLVAHLHVLVRPHILGGGCGQTVEACLLKNVKPLDQMDPKRVQCTIAMAKHRAQLALMNNLKQVSKNI